MGEPLLYLNYSAIDYILDGFKKLLFSILDRKT